MPPAMTKHDQLVRIGRKADRRGAALVVAEAADHHAELGATRR